MGILKEIPDIDQVIDGLLVHGDNFQSLNLLRELSRNKIKSVYIDPPYNTDGGPIVYKNGYRKVQLEFPDHQSTQKHNRSYE